MKVALAIFMFMCVVLLTLPFLYRHQNNKYYYWICFVIGLICYVAMKFLIPEVNLSRYVLITFPLLIGVFFFYEWVLHKKHLRNAQRQLKDTKAMIDQDVCRVCKQKSNDFVDYDTGENIGISKVCKKCLDRIINYNCGMKQS